MIHKGFIHVSLVSKVVFLIYLSLSDNIILKAPTCLYKSYLTHDGFKLNVMIVTKLRNESNKRLSNEQAGRSSKAMWLNE